MKTIWFFSQTSMLPEMALRPRTNYFAKYLSQLGYKVEVFIGSTIHNTDTNLIKDKRSIHETKRIDGVVYNIIRTPNYRGSGLRRVFSIFTFQFRLYRVSRKKKVAPDVIISNPQSIFGVIPYYISRRLKSGYISEVRDLWPESIVVYKNISRKNPIISFMYYMEKWIYKKANKIIFSMEGGKDYIAQKGWAKEIDLSKVYHINNGVDLDAFNTNVIHSSMYGSNLDSASFKVIYTGSIGIANNVQKIIEAAKVIHEKGYDILFLIYGDGADRKRLEKLCETLKLNNVIFKGLVDKNEIPFILTQGQLNIFHFKQSSLKNYGASLNKIFEYFASGRPIISDCLFGYDLIEKYNCGMVLDNSDAKGLARGIITFYNMPKEQYDSYCNNALMAAQDFDYKKLVEKLVQVIETLE